MTGNRQEKQIRAALYARVSTVGHGQDVGLQLDELRVEAARQGWQPIEFVDNGFSGAKESRPGLDALMKAVRAGEVHAVLVWKFDRFARSTRHLLDALEEFRQRNIQFISLRENISTQTPVGKTLFVLVAAVAELERELTMERVRAGVDRAKEKGVKFGRPKVELDLRATQALLSQGHSLRSVSSMLGLPRATIRRRLQEAGLWLKIDTNKGGPKVGE